MSDNWSWYFASEYRRDNMLRDELGAASAAAASANRSASRLRSQLAQVQGSLEKRLNALSRAFDAYVELGDIREQLVDFGDTRMIRRDAVQAVEAMSAGVVPDPLDPDRYDSRYWLLDAMNAVIALAGGQRDEALEERVVRLDPGSELFQVGCAAALGHGAQLQDRLPTALASDGGWDPAQVVVADAVAAGLFGPDALPALAAVVSHQLAAPSADWPGWLRTASGTGETDEQLRWLERHQEHPGGPGGPADARQLVRPVAEPGRNRWQAKPPPEASPPPPDDAGSRLQALVASLIEQGSSAERELIERAAVLRAQIEDPGRSPDRATAAGQDEPGPRVPVRDIVLGWTEDETAPQVQQVAREWVRPHLLALAEQIPAELRHPDLDVSISHAGWRIKADEAGVDREMVRRSRSGVTDEPTPRPSVAIGCWVAAGLAVVVGAVSTAGSVTAGLVLVVIGIVLAGAGFWLFRRHGRGVVSERQRRLAALDAAVERAEAELDQQRAARQHLDTEHRERREQLLTRLRAPQTIQPTG